MPREVNNFKVNLLHKSMYTRSLGMNNDTLRKSVIQKSRSEGGSKKRNAEDVQRTINNKSKVVVSKWQTS